MAFATTRGRTALGRDAPIGEETVVLDLRRNPPSRLAVITSPLFDGVVADRDAVQVGRYRVLQRLGRGGMATVVRALDPEIQREVAIKFLHAGLCEEGECRTRFLREARAAGGLSHPNIVAVHDVGEIEGRPYMTMELLDGGSLNEELERRRRLPAPEVIALGIQLALALDHAHSRGVVHRDLKPANVLRDVGTGTVKLTDFGIAHLDEPAGDAEHRTRVGDVIGTPQYMSPEQARGEKLDGRSDLFSLGIVLYQMLSGVPPFRGDSMVAVATRIANEPAPPFAPEHQVPAPLCRLIERCLAKDPDDRFQSGAELAQALLEVEGSLGTTPLISALTPSPTLWPTPSSQASTPRSSSGRSAADSSVRRPAQRRRWPSRLALGLGLIGLLGLVGLAGAAGAFMGQRSTQGLLQAQSSQQATRLARLVAAQNAALVLDDDWAGVEVAVERLLASGEVLRITVTDRQGVVRAEGRRGDGRDRSDAGVPMMAAEVPILFQEKVLGRLTLVPAPLPAEGKRASR